MGMGILGTLESVAQPRLCSTHLLLLKPSQESTPVQTDALHALEILAQGLVEEVGVLLGGLAVLSRRGRKIFLRQSAKTCRTQTSSNMTRSKAMTKSPVTP